MEEGEIWHLEGTQVVEELSLQTERGQVLEVTQPCPSSPMKQRINESPNRRTVTVLDSGSSTISICRLRNTLYSL